MKTKRAELLNRLVRELPEGYVADAAWLKSKGLGASSVRNYVERGWLERAGSRLYRRPAANRQSPMSWELAVLSLQRLLDCPAHVGGMTALELAGYWQYVPMGRRHVWLYSGTPRVRSYFERLDLDADVDVTARNLFDEPDLGLETHALDLVSSKISPVQASEQETGYPSHLLRVSSLERAILEVLDRVPNDVSFEHAAELFDGLTTLRPKLVEKLLNACTSFKTKRLFLYMARDVGPAWSRKLAPSRFDIGSGKRQIVEDGEYDAEFMITVPRKKGARRNRARL